MKIIYTWTLFCSDLMTGVTVIGNWYSFSLGNINKSFRLEPLLHLEIIRMKYASSSRKCSVCSDWSHNMNAKDYFHFWLAKCKQNPTTLAQMCKFWPSLQELCLEILLQKQSDKKHGSNMFVWCMRCNATFNSISVMSWQFVLLVEEIGVPGENHRPIADNWQTLSHNVVSRTSRHEGGSNLKL
jgi:hypothetical protein